MSENLKKDIKEVCSSLYDEAINPILKGNNQELKEKILQANIHNIYKEHKENNSPIKVYEGENCDKLKNMLQKLCDGKNHANHYMKKFLLQHGYCSEIEGKILPSEKLLLSASQNNAPGGYTKTQNGKVLIHMHGGSFAYGDEILAVNLGHELTHIMINEKIGKNAVATEIETLCDTMGIAVAKGAGYSVAPFIQYSEQNYDKEAFEKNIIDAMHQLNRNLPESEQKSEAEINSTTNALYNNMVNTYNPSNLILAQKIANASILLSEQSNKSHSLQTDNKINSSRGIPLQKTQQSTPPLSQHSKQTSSKEVISKLIKDKLYSEIKR